MWFTINIEQTHFFSLSFKVASYLSFFISHYFPVQNSLSTRFVTILLSQTYRLTHTNIPPYAYTLLILVSVMLCHYFFYLKCFPFFSIGNSIRASLTFNLTYCSFCYSFIYSINNYQISKDLGAVWARKKHDIWFLP